MGSTIYLTVFFTTLSTMGQCQQLITCAAGRFKAGQTASATCNFHRNLENTGHHVIVVHYPTDTPDDSLGNDIVRCFRSYDHKPICVAAKGVQINSNITDRLTFHIPEVTTDFAGRYMCQLVPPDDTVLVFCSLTVEGTLTQNKTENVAESEDSSWLKIAAIPVLLLFNILCVIASVYCIRKRTFIIRKLDQYNSKIRKGQTVQVVAHASVGLSDRNDYSGIKPTHDFNKKHHPTVSGKQDSPVCQDMSYKPIKPPNSSTGRAGPCSYSAMESQNDQVYIPSRQPISTVRSNSPISCRGDDVSYCSSMQSVLYVDDFHSVNESDSSCSFHSSTDVLEQNESRCSNSGGVLFITESCPPIVTIVADPAEGLSAD